MSRTEPTPAVTIRDATEADLPRLIELIAQLSLEAPREDTRASLAAPYIAAFRAIEADARQRLLVVEAAGRIVGTAALIIVPNISHVGRPYAIAENVVIDAAERRAGYGEALMRHAMESAREAGCYKLSLTSNKERPEAHRFYRRLGFRATHEGFRIDL
jgi:ribosomal protein S18 acetylase RimI-like enzyme